MYRRHVVITILIGVLVTVISYLLSFDYIHIAETAIDIMGIASAVYLAIYPLLQGSENLIKKLSTQDLRLPKKTQMGVLNTYLKVGLIMGITSIVCGCVVLLTVGSYAETIEKLPVWYRLLSSAAIGQFASNFPLLWFVGEFMVHRVAFNR